jgi:hypothetical protein
MRFCGSTVPSLLPYYLYAYAGAICYICAVLGHHPGQYCQRGADVNQAALAGLRSISSFSFRPAK